MNKKIRTRWQRFGWIFVVLGIIIIGCVWYWYQKDTKHMFVIPSPTISRNTTAPKNTGTQNEYAYTEAPDHIGETTHIRGTVVRAYTSKSGTIFLDFCKQYSTCPFSIVIFGDDAKKFISGVAPYENKTVIASGTIQTYNNQAEMVITNPSQIRIQK